MCVRRDNVKRAFNTTYLGGVLDEMMSGDTITLNVINKLNDKLKFLYRKNIFLSTELPRMLCITLIQPHFDYACPDWHHNLLKKRKKKTKIIQNKCIKIWPKTGQYASYIWREFWNNILVTCQQKKGLHKLRARLRPCTQSAHKRRYACTKIPALYWFFSREIIWISQSPTQTNIKTK